MTPPVCRFVWMDGALVDGPQARVPFLTAGLHYGIGVFEGIRSHRRQQYHEAVRGEGPHAEWLTFVAEASAALAHCGSAGA